MTFNHSTTNPPLFYPFACLLQNMMQQWRMPGSVLTLVGRRKESLPSKRLGRSLLNCPVYCSQQLTSAPLPRKPVKAAAALHLTRIVVTAAVAAVTTTTVAAVTTKISITVAVILTTATAFNTASHHVPR